MIDKTEIECRFRRSVDSYEDNQALNSPIERYSSPCPVTAFNSLKLFFPDLGNRVWHRTLIRKNQPALGGSAILGE